MTREDTALYINNQQPTFLQAAKVKGQFICPNCGHGKSGDGLKLHNGHWKCFGPCGENHNVIGWYAIYKDLQDTPDNYTEALEGAADYYGVTIDSNIQTAPKKPTLSASLNNEVPISADEEYIKRCAAVIDQTDYLQKRGISLETCKAFNIGYDTDYKTFNRNENGLAEKATWKAVIIPTGNGSRFIARNTDKTADEKNKVRKNGSVQFMYAPKHFEDKPIFIVEGEIDALSIYEAGGQAIGIGGTSNGNRLIEKLTESKDRIKTNQIFIPVLDNDDPGQKAQEDLVKKLNEAELRYYVPEGFYGDNKDANEYLLADPEGLKAKIEETVTQVIQALEKEKNEAIEEYRRQNNVANQLQNFINGISASVNTPPISTGFSALDYALEGGLYEGLYCLGAVSSLGKTTLTMQIGDQIAQNGNDVLIISLEMARNQLIAKSISRHTLLEVKDIDGNISLAKTSRGITTGARYENYSEREKRIIKSSIEKYSEYAENIYIVEGIGTVGAEEIKEQVKKHIEITGKRPVLIIDYLQILKAVDVRATDKRNIDENVLALKQLSRDYKIPIIAISSFNREGYKGGASKEASMTDFKESGAIEYGSDVLIGLHFKGAGQKGFDLDEAYNNDPREVELKILKNREGKPGQRIPFKFYPKFNYFEEGN